MLILQLLETVLSRLNPLLKSLHIHALIDSLGRQRLRVGVFSQETQFGSLGQRDQLDYFGKSADQTYYMGEGQLFFGDIRQD